METSARPGGLRLLSLLLVLLLGGRGDLRNGNALERAGAARVGGPLHGSELGAVGHLSFSLRYAHPLVERTLGVIALYHITINNTIISVIGMLIAPVRMRRPGRET